MLTGLISQIAIFVVVLFAFNYFIALRKRPDRFKASLTMTAISAAIFGLIVWLWSTG